MTMTTAEWLERQTPVIQRWKMEDDAFRRYCVQRESHSAEALARFFTPYDRYSDFEKRFAAERLLGRE